MKQILFFLILVFSNFFLKSAFAVDLLEVYNISLKNDPELLDAEFKNKSTFKFTDDNFEEKIYFLSSAVVVICFFTFSNFVYREIFLIGLFPFIIKQRNLANFSKFFQYYYYSLILKFLISFPITYVYMNRIVDNLKLIVIFKYMFDLFVIALVGAIFIAQLYWLFKNLLIQKKINFSKNS